MEFEELRPMEFVQLTPEEAQFNAAAVASMHGLVAAMGMLAEGMAPPPAATTGLTSDRLGELMASDPNITDERLAELGHLFRDSPPGNVPDPDAPPDAENLSDGIPSDYGPGHED